MAGTGKILIGKSEEVLKGFADNSVDSCVTDPPYGLKFMGKKWDYEVPKVELWKEVFRVLKPGAHILVACGTRTQHRMAVNIEDAGFEIRDNISYFYDGSEDINNFLYSLNEEQQRAFIKILNESDPAVVSWIYASGFPKSLSVGKAIDLLEKNTWIDICKLVDNMNKVYILTSWKYSLENVKHVEPLSRKSQIEIGTSTPKKDSAQNNVAQSVVLLKKLSSAIVAELSFTEAHRTLAIREIIVQENAGVITIQFQSHAKSVELLLQSQKAKQCIITSIVQCVVRDLLKEKTKANLKEEEVLKIWLGKKKLLSKQDINVLNVAVIEGLKRIILSQSKTFQNLDTISQTGCVFATTATITESIMECLISNTVDILKKYAIDKQAGAEREVVGKGTSGETRSVMNAALHPESFGGEFNITAPATDEAKKWDGWGTALKPSTEFWTLARKPLSEDTVAANVLKYGTGGINIDGTRIGDRGKEQFTGAKNGTINAYGDYFYKKSEIPLPSGRFPANLILDEFIGSELDKQSGITASSGGSGKKSMGALGKNGKYGDYALNVLADNAGGLGDTGGASRFFYCAKASKSERNKGLKDFYWRRDSSVEYGFVRITKQEYEQLNEVDRAFGNIHPTVKPVSLMKYLIKLITPKDGVVIDMFAGSGTTGVAADELEIDYVLIDKFKENCEMAEARIPKIKKQKDLFS